MKNRVATRNHNMVGHAYVFERWGGEIYQV